MSGVAALGSPRPVRIGHTRRFSNGVRAARPVPRARDLSRHLAGALLLYFGWILPGPSYNLLNSAAMLAASGLLLSAVARRSTGLGLNVSQRWAVLGVGAALGVSFFRRFPSAVSLLGVALLIGYGWVARGVRLRFVLWLALGLGVWVAVHFVFFQDPSSWYQQSRIWVSVRAAAPGRLWSAIAAEIPAGLRAVSAARLARLSLLFLLLLIARHCRRWVRRASARARRVPFLDLVLVALLLLFAVRSVYLGYQYGGDEYYRRLITFYLSFLPTWPACWWSPGWRALSACTMQLTGGEPSRTCRSSSCC